MDDAVTMLFPKFHFNQTLREESNRVNGERKENLSLF
jgi:hypothetical protein